MHQRFLTTINTPVGTNPQSGSVSGADCSDNLWGSAIFQDIVDYVNNWGSIASGWFVTPEQQAAMVDMCQASGWQKPDKFSLDPVNRAAEISRQQMEQLRLRYPACELGRCQTSTVATDYALQSGHIQFRETLQLNIYQ